MDELWNQKLDRNNIIAFYDSTVGDVYTAVFRITKEATRAEQAIVKTYVELYQQRAGISGEDVPYIFGDILLKNSNEIVEKYPLPDNLTFNNRLLDEYTMNSMREKIVTKIDSASFKMVEFMSSSDPKKAASEKPSLRRATGFIAITPLLVIELIIVALVIWGVSYTLITVPYKNDALVDESKIFSSTSLQEKYVSILPYVPFDVKYPEAAVSTDDTAASEFQTDTQVTDTAVSDTSATDTSSSDTAASETVEDGAEPSATMG